MGRGEFLSGAAAVTAAVLGIASSGVAGVNPASALVKGNAPPPGYNKKRGSGYGNGEPGESLYFICGVVLRCAKCISQVPSIETTNELPYRSTVQGCEVVGADRWR